MADLVLLLVPGSFAVPALYEDNALKGVKERGYDIRCLHMPTVGLAPREGRPGSPPTMYDDAAFIASEAERLSDEGKDVIIIGHSYGGIPVTQSIRGLTKQERQKHGKNGGVVRVVYMTCLVPPVGQSAKDVLGEVPKGQEVPLTVGVRFPILLFLTLSSLTLLVGGWLDVPRCTQRDSTNLSQSLISRRR